MFFLDIKMTNNFHQKHKEKLRKDEKRPKKNIKILLKKKKKRSFSVIANVIKIFLRNKKEAS